MDGSKSVQCTCRCTCRSTSRNTSELQSNKAQKCDSKQTMSSRKTAYNTAPLDHEKQRLICLMEAQSSHINKELKQLQLEGELTSAAIQAIRCRNHHPIAVTEPTSSQPRAAHHAHSRSTRDPSCDAQTTIQPVDSHSGSSEWCHTRQHETNRSMLPVPTKPDNQYACGCRRAANPVEDAVLNTELSALRRRQEALAERIQSLQQCRTTLLQNLNQLVKSGLTVEPVAPGTSSNQDVNVPSEVVPKEFEHRGPSRTLEPSRQNIPVPSSSNGSPTPGIKTVYPSDRPSVHVDRECQTEVAPPEHSQPGQSTLNKPPDANASLVRSTSSGIDLGKHPATVSALAAVAAMAAASFLSKAMSIQTPSEETHSEQPVATSSSRSGISEPLTGINWLHQGQKVIQLPSSTSDCATMKEDDATVHRIPLPIVSTNVLHKPHPMGSLTQPISDNNLATTKSLSPLKSQLILQSFCNDGFATTAITPYRYNSTPATLQRHMASEKDGPDLIEEPAKVLRADACAHSLRLGVIGTHRRRSVDLADRAQPARFEESHPLKFPPACLSESQTPNIPRTAFSERLLIARKAVDEGKFGSFRPTETDETVHLNVARRIREELDSEPLEPYNLVSSTKSYGTNINTKQKASSHGMERHADLLENSNISSRTGQTFPNRQRPISTESSCYSARPMPVQVVKPALRQTVTLDSSGHETGSPSDSTASMKSDERPGLFDTERRIKRLSADASSSHEDRVSEHKPKSALVSEHKRTQRQQKYDKTGGSQRTVVWMDEICGDSSPNLSDGKRDSANETQESGSVRSSTQIYPYPEPDLPIRAESSETFHRTEGRCSLPDESSPANPPSLLCMDVHTRASNYLIDHLKQQKYRRSLPDPRMMSKHWPADGK